MNSKLWLVGGAFVSTLLNYANAVLLDINNEALVSRRKTPISACSSVNGNSFLSYSWTF